MANMLLGKVKKHSLNDSEYGKKLLEAEEALSSYKPFEYSNEGAFQNAQNALLKRDEFKYDVNSDEMYKAYKDMYERQGNLAMKDTVGQVAAMSGGYGNSYAQTAGQQIYQAYMDTLNDRIPELYSMALNKYQAEGDRLAQNYALLDAERQNEYNKYMDARNILLADRDYYANMNIDERNYNYQLDRDKIADNRYDTEWDYAVSRDKIADDRYNTEWKYKTEQDAIDNAREQQSMNETIRMNDYAIKDGDRTYALNAAKMYSGGGSGSGSNDIPTFKYNNIADYEKTILSSDRFYENAKKGTWQTNNKGVKGETKYTYNGVDYNNYQDYAVQQIKKSFDLGELDPYVAEAMLNAYGYVIDENYNIKKK